MFTRMLMALSHAAALIVSVSALSPCTAKPPDLPIQQNFVCGPSLQTAEVSACNPVQVADQDASSEVLLPGDCSGAILVHVFEQYHEAALQFWTRFLTITQYLEGMERACVFSEPACPADRRALPPDRTELPADMTCPYMRAQAAPQTKAKGKVNDSADGVLENLQKLQRADALMQTAEHQCRMGDFESACKNYEQIQKLCPGSSYDHEAAARLVQIYVGILSRTAIAEGEEQEVSCDKDTKGEISLGPISVSWQIDSRGHGSLTLAIGYGKDSK